MCITVGAAVVLKVRRVLSLKCVAVPNILPTLLRAIGILHAAKGSASSGQPAVRVCVVYVIIGPVVVVVVALS